MRGRRGSPLPARSTVLVASADPWIRHLAVWVLEPERHMVLETAWAHEVESIVAARAPAVIILDLELRGGDGWEVARRLRAEPATAAIPLLARSADQSEFTLHRIRRAGFAGVVRLPAQSWMLPRQVARVLQGRTGADTAPRIREE